MTIKKILLINLAFLSCTVPCAVIFQNWCILRSEKAHANTRSALDTSWPGWRRSVLRYEATRAPDQHYSTETLQEASEAFLRDVLERDHVRTVHWSAVRLICETMKMTVFYAQQEQNRDDEQKRRAP